MRVCDCCKDENAKVLLIYGKIDTTPAFAGSSGDFYAELCRACFDQLRGLIKIRDEATQKGKT